MKHFIHTFRFQILSLFLLISIPAVGLSLAASRANLEEARKQVLTARTIPTPRCGGRPRIPGISRPESG